MLKRVLVLAVLSVLFVASGCQLAPVQPPLGMIFSQIRAPVDIDCDNTDLGSKVGQAGAVSVLGLIAVGDASVQAAARQAGITTVKHLDYEFMNILGLYTNMKITAYGD